MTKSEAADALAQAAQNVIESDDNHIFTRDLIKALTVYDDAQDDDGWRSISTAPTDGRKILVGFMGQFEWFSFAAMALGKNSRVTFTTTALPTHWRPLPLPPRALGEGK